jgi:elongation factor P--(R)-beta-lysine ligase
MSGGADWRPGASRERLVARARMLARIREFFAARDVLEVDTPVIVNAAVSDVHIHSARVELTPEIPAGAHARFFLHTSPEYAMKRLLAAGSGDIYQVCHVARALETGRVHNPEFTLLEWYRIGFSLGQLMDEVEMLVCGLLGGRLPEVAAERLTYREAFLRELALDPFEATPAQLASAAVPLDLGASGAALDRDGYLELLMGAIIGPRLGNQRLTFIHSYPASQAALARLDPADPRAAQRFELYARGIELANGFHELANPAEQRARFEADNAARARAGLPVNALDERLLCSLGDLPDCAGVALGLDRLLMLATGAGHIEEVLAFPTLRA